ncbi:hypothetical protein ADILRU_1825 [Leifsonia rubra CMS 76R]|nr:hypothetical protein ADILRU_1825 [Leifsonia rubra CMS 76R]
MNATKPTLFISLSGIARLAQVQRPVVSMWRTRAAASESPFPAPVAEDRGSEVFDARQVAQWLVATGRGNNPEVVADASAYARFDATGRGDAGAFEALTALVALRAAADEPIGAFDRERLLDLADEVDPDDTSIQSEIGALGDELVPMARFVDVLVDGAYGVSAAFESLLAERFRDGRRALTRTALEPQATALVSEVAVELARSNPAANADEPVFVDPTGACGDLLIAVLASVVESVDSVAMTANSAGAGARLLRRRLIAHHLPQSSLAVSPTGEFSASGAPVHLAQFPNPVSPVMSAGQILSAIDNIVLQMDDAQRAVVLAPASVLTDGRLAPEADAIRSEILRSGKLRAIVRLPRGLVTSNPRQSLALWVFGPAHASVARAEKWTLVADLGDERLTPASRTDLVSDLTAAMGDESSIRAHAFRFTRAVATAALLARSGSLVASTKSVVTVPHSAVTARRQRAGSDFPARLDAVLARLGDDTPEGVRHITLTNSPLFLPDEMLGSLADSGHVRCLPGARLSATHLGAETGYSVIGVEELTGQLAVGSRKLDRLQQASEYPAARLTEPGDVVFCTSPQRHAVVDAAGFSVVSYPARILRIAASDPAGLLAELLASDIARQSSREWKRWQVRRVVPTERAGLAKSIASIAVERALLAERLRTLDDLESVLVGGVVAGTLTTTNSLTTSSTLATTGSDAAIIAPPEGSI